MHDPLPAPPSYLIAPIRPFFDSISLPLLPNHIHEIFAAFVFYYCTNTLLSPRLSSYLFPKIYPSLPDRTRRNWDAHIVSLVQSTFVNVLALWVMWVDQERAEMNWQQRLWGYTGASGMVQAFAGGYFLWDLMVCIQHFDIFGWGLLAHAICALSVFCLGYRPFVTFYAPTFILYELSSPFLNFHWFFDKLQMTGSRAQLINGIILLVTFFFCRLMWGTYQSLRVYQDVWAGLHITTSQVVPITPPPMTPQMEVMAYAYDQSVPTWLALAYLGSNTCLNTLNFYWFGKMIETIRKRFRAPKGRKERMQEVVKEDGEGLAHVSSTVDVKGNLRTLTMEEVEVRKRRG
ncbi:MAG: hypothetical protein M1814_000894 [Vezdaea aestivalis]|nr:MAG: hypothetical protein M1814_000894 [Vezdaea aestivalis]